MLADSKINSTECFCSLMRICSCTASKLATCQWGESVLLLQSCCFVEDVHNKVPPEQKWNDAAQKCLKHVDCSIRVLDTWYLTVLLEYCIIKKFHCGKLSQLHKLLVICGKLSRLLVGQARLPLLINQECVNSHSLHLSCTTVVVHNRDRPCLHTFKHKQERLQQRLSKS